MVGRNLLVTVGPATRRGGGLGGRWVHGLIVASPPAGNLMFRAWCTAEGAEVLLSTRRIRRMVIDGSTATIEFTCWCGHRGRVTDERLDREAGPVVAPAAATPAPRVGAPA